MTAIVKAETSGVLVRPLRVLIPLIVDDLKQGRDAAERAGLPYYRAAGEKMLEAKPQLGHGEFQAWLHRHFSISYTQAKLYMGLAATQQKGAAASFSSLNDFRRATESHYTDRASWHDPVQKIVNRVDTETLNLKRDELKRFEERDAQRTLALQLIDIGYKVLARKLHPDRREGSKDAMARLNAVRDRLKNCV